ncbi:DNA-binding SARP family transcriptional activator/predicted negative regulator of RcsB-dependent stress response [Crossiella equi]|uniref:DNA-binding SARP family transcriptional activator/predicted negative regulator of RcsB-dependent stress response n=1 Tax=Crossiella equi TaxID=130796 RepID=A0ABS5AB21_9PSEU|nr:BTAD domain-containing putative transcriptional regulator [Crossiella equi]MBP2473775.1 DNA-binding SARP family transcriptional activator/predicted negative regulator of RcsB-dependent stress response [Crossiella equi]
MITGLDFRVLGPLEVADGEVPLRIGAAQHRVLLTCLLLRPGKPVDAETIVGHLWPAGYQPRQPRAAVHTYVQRLRTVIGQDTIRTTGRGYVLDVPEDQVDLHRFRAHLRRADEAGDTATEYRELAAALAHWRGEPFADVPAETLCAPEADRATAQRLTALERRLQLDLDRGAHQEVITELQQLTRVHPLHEVFWSQLVLALYRSQRQAEALRAYRTAADTLQAELGVGPGPRLRRAHETVLVGEAAAPAPPAPPRLATDPWRPARQLPSDIGDFTGRRAELAEVTGALTDGGHSRVLLCGQPGVGKTALAVRAGHRLRESFPDGQLYVNLHGCQPGEELGAGQVLGQFLRALGVPADQVPYGEAARRDRFRALLRGRRVLVLLDNAASPEVLLPLLPDVPGCAALVTSRSTLSTVDFHRTRIDPLDEGDSLSLLGTILGADALAAQPEAAAELAELCARLPLALRIAAANLTIRGEPDLPAYVHELATGDRLDALAIDGDDDAAVHRAFDFSYATLSVPVRRLFRCLGLVPGPDFTADVAAALAQCDREHAQELLSQLATAHLIEEHRPGRYQFHDLLRLYTGQQRELEDDPAAQEAARTRLYEYFLDCAGYATVLLYAEAPRSGAVVGKLAPFDDAGGARRWLDAEREALIAAVLAGRHRPDAVTVHLATALVSHFWTNGHFEEQARICEAGLLVAQRLDDVVGQADMHSGLSAVLSLYGRVVDSLRHGAQARGRYQAAGDGNGEALVLTNLGTAYEVAARFPQAIARYTQAAEVSRRIGYPAGEAYALQGLQSVYANVGRLREAHEAISQALAITRQYRARESEVLNLVLAAVTLSELGEFEDAHGQLDLAHALAGQLGSGLQERMVEEGRALVHMERRDMAAARRHLDRALAVADGNSRDRLEPRTLNLIGYVHCGLREWEQARRHFEAARELASTSGHPAFPVMISTGLALVHRRSGFPGIALEYVAEAEATARRTGLVTSHGDALTELALVRLSLGEAHRALGHAEEAVATHQRSGRRPGEAAALTALGDVLLVTHGPEQARACWRRSLALHTSLEMVELGHLHRRLARV